MTQWLELLPLSQKVVGLILEFAFCSVCPCGFSLSYFFFFCFLPQFQEAPQFGKKERYGK